MCSSAFSAGSFDYDNPDAVVESELGLTGIPFMDGYTVCASAATAVMRLTAERIRSAASTSVWRSGWTKHYARSLLACASHNADPVD